ncbi:MFS transporter [Pseudalkalibacillus caeni]|uniref:MFS transporter n=1 Tax=Exobacillus caeni TaxID=2574798 RepID=A0A5R9FGZ1_9BACL|nr:MFS transporter [Pseudalkalibacillus caeni]TLS38815.1 MFS transporter [Pseudalkalibacillus caeni]
MKKLTASQVYLVIACLSSLANTIMFTTYAVYYVMELGLNPFQLVLVGTILEVTILLLENVTGVVADTYSRRLSVIIGMFVLGTAYLLEGSIPFVSETLLSNAVPLVAAVILSEMVRGVGETFLSGAEQAWITDEIGDKRVGSLFIRANQLRQASMVVGVIISVGLASISLNLPYLAGGILFLFLGIFLVIAMPETGFKPESPEGNSNALQSMFFTFKNGINSVRGRPILMLVILVTIFSGAAFEGFARLWEAHFLNTFTLPELGALEPVVWFGIINIVANLLSIVAAEIFNRKLDTNNSSVIIRSLLILTCLQVIGLAVFGLAGNFAVGLISYWVLVVIGTLSGPMYQAWLNQNIDSRTRATVLSFMSQSDAFGQSAGGPVVGAVGTRFSLRAAMVFSAILLMPAVVVYMRILTQTKTSTVSDDNEEALKR